MTNKNRIWFWSSAIIIVAILTMIIINIAKPQNQGSTIITGQEWTKGNPEASVTLIEYSDFQCPACAIYYQMANKIAQEMGEDVKVIFRHYPLTSIHPQADLAARAAESAGQQDTFWSMHDKLFANQKDWSGNTKAEEIFIGYAQELNLDIEKFKADLENSNIKDAIKDDKRSGNQALVEGTPTFFLNGKKITNPRSYDKLRQIINDELSKTK